MSNKVQRSEDSSTDPSGEVFNFDLLDAGEMIDNTVDRTIEFKLNSTAEVVLQIVSPVGDTSTYTVEFKNPSDQTIVASQVLRFDSSNFENLGLKPNVANTTNGFTLIAGNYIAEVTGGTDPLGIAILRGDSKSGGVMQFGESFHSGPLAYRESPAVLVSAHTRLGSNQGYVRCGNMPPIDVLSFANVDVQEKWHASHTIIKMPTSGRVVSVRVDHQSSMFGRSAPSVAELAEASDVQLTASRSLTYQRVVVTPDDRLFYLTRRLNGLLLIEVDPVTMSVIDEDWIVIGAANQRFYVLSFQYHEADNGDPLLSIGGLIRASRGSDYWRTPAFVMVKDLNEGARGQYYNIAGNALGHDTTGDSEANPRFNAVFGGAPFEEVYSLGGFEILGNASTCQRYGCSIVNQVHDWSATNKRFCTAVVSAETATQDFSIYQNANYAFTVVDSNGNRWSAFAAPGSSDSDSNPFGIDPSRSYRGGSEMFFDVNDSTRLIIAVSTGHNEARTDFYGKDVPLYYNMFGDRLSIFEVINPFSGITSHDDLNAKVTAVSTHTSTTLGGGTDHDGNNLPIGHVRQIPGENELFIQVGRNRFDSSQEAGTFATLTI